MKRVSAEQKKEKARARNSKWYSGLSEDRKDEIRKNNNARAKEWYRKNRSVIREASKERAKKYRKEHELKVKECIDRWHKDHPDRVNKNRIKWEKNHPENKIERRHRRRIKEKNTGESFTGYEWKLLCSEYGNICLKCGQNKPLTPDHVIPISLGGSNSIDNIQPLCLECNLWKHTKIIDFRKRKPVHVEQLSFDLVGL